MEREGRWLEQLVSLLEQFADETGAVFESPGFINSPDPGERQREIDVLVRRKVGTVEILVLIECRDRAGHQGVDWIEQIDAKRRSLQASAAVAVSRSGFTTGAIAAAARFGIELRSVNDITLDDFSSWATWVDMLVQNRRAEIQQIYIEFETTEGTDAAAALGDLPTDTACFVADQTGERMTAGQLWDGAVSPQDSVVYRDLPAGEFRGVRINAIYSQPGLGVTFDWGGIVTRVKAIKFEARVWIEESTQPMHPMAYSGVGGVEHGRVLETSVDGKQLHFFMSPSEDGVFRIAAAVDGQWMTGEAPPAGQSSVAIRADNSDVVAE